MTNPIFSKAAEEYKPKDGELGKLPVEAVNISTPEALTNDRVFEYLDSNDGAHLQYLSKKVGKDVNSLEDLRTVETIEKIVEKTVEVEKQLPDDVKRYWDFKIETGRGINDFIEANKDWSTFPKESVVMEYIRQTDGYDGEQLDKYFNLKFKPNSEKMSDSGMSTYEIENRVEMANLDLDKAYRSALNFLNEKKNKYTIPSQEVVDQRRAVDTELEQRRIFSEGMTTAMNNLKEYAVDDFKFKVELPNEVKDNYHSVEGIMRTYTQEGKFNYDKFFADLYAGQNAKNISKSYAEHLNNIRIEEDMKKKVNYSAGQSSSASAGDTAAVESKFRNQFFRK